MTALRGRRLQRTAATVGVLALALGGGVLTAASASAADPLPVVKKLTIPGGSEDGGDVLVIRGTDLATWTPGEGEAPGTWGTAGDVMFGEAKAAEVTALSATAIKVTVPEAADAEHPTKVGKPKMNVKVLVGAGTKGAKFTYYAEKPTVTANETCTATSEDTNEGGVANSAVEIEGTGLDAKFTKITVGGKAVKDPTFAADGKKVSIVPPKKLVGVNDIAVVDKRAGTLYAGYCVYEGIKPTLAEDAVNLGYVINEGPTVVTLTGTKLNLIKTATYNGEKAKVKVNKADATTLQVTVPAGDAVAKGKIKVMTKYGEYAESEDLERKAGGTPKVSGFGATEPGTTKATVDLVGENLIGLKSVVVTAAVGSKTYKGSKPVVTAADEATINLPALPDNADYSLVATTYAGSSTAYEFTVGTVEEEAEVPVITKVEGNALTAGGTALSLTGTDFTGLDAATVYVAGEAAVDGLTVTVGDVTATTAALTLSEGLEAGDYEITVTADGGTSEKKAFTVEAAG
ncbi:MAG: hypothetical protein GXX79_19215 [Actinomycetales bacterium]|nr:hypothetical protein [Actinomycetales bacterium]